MRRVTHNDGAVTTMGAVYSLAGMGSRAEGGCLLDAFGTALVVRHRLGPWMLRSGRNGGGCGRGASGALVSVIIGAILLARLSATGRGRSTGRHNIWWVRRVRLVW